MCCVTRGEGGRKGGEGGKDEGGREGREGKEEGGRGGVTVIHTLIIIQWHQSI